MSSFTPPPAAASGGASTKTTTAAERKEAAEMRMGEANANRSSPVAERIAHIPQVLIDQDAVQKYVLIAVHGVKENEAKYFVRGMRSASYHKDAARPLVNELNTLKVPFEVIGGGRIDHQSSKQSIKVFGFSYGFPWKNGESKHHVTADLLRDHYTTVYKVDWSDEGY